MISNTPQPSPSLIPPELREAYIATRFILDHSGLSIMVGENSPSVDELCAEHNHRSWLFITPYNPRSQPLSREENEARLEKLRAILINRNLTFFEGEGRGEDPSWEPERSCFVLGASRELAIELGLLFDQFAVVYGDIGAKAELLEMPLPHSAPRPHP